MKLQRIGLLLVLVCFVGISIVSTTWVRYEQRKTTNEILAKGNALVSLIALHSMEDLSGKKRSLFLKTLHGYVASESLLYCLIHDQNHDILVSLDPKTIVPDIPDHVPTTSLYTLGMRHQTFQLAGSGEEVYEFSKPFFHDGQQIGTVRIGLSPPDISLFSMDAVVLLSMVALVLFAMAPLIYYGAKRALRPIQHLCATLENMTRGDGRPSDWGSQDQQVDGVLNKLNTSLELLREDYERLQTQNVSYQAKKGVLSYEKRQLEHILDSVQHGILVTNLHDSVTHVNAYMLRLLGKKRDDVIDRPLVDVIEDEKLQAFVSSHLQNKTSGRQRHMEMHFPNLPPEEEYEITYASLAPGDGPPVGHVIAAKNVSGIKSFEKAKHKFVANVAHELRSPLTTIKSYNEMLMNEEIDDHETQKEFYNTINTETERLASLIEELLNISKIELGTLSLNRGLVKTGALISDCLASVNGQAKKKHITIQKQMPDKYPTLVGDKELLKVALINLLGNAIKYTPENKKILLALGDENGTVKFDVTDQGCGISKEDLPHIFEEFYRSGDPSVRNQTGSGLGLATVTEIIHLHGGEIDVRSKLGTGSRFTISIPKEEYQLGKQ